MTNGDRRAVKTKISIACYTKERYKNDPKEIKISPMK